MADMASNLQYLGNIQLNHAAAIESWCLKWGLDRLMDNDGFRLWYGFLKKENSKNGLVVNNGYNLMQYYREFFALAQKSLNFSLYQIPDPETLFRKSEVQVEN